MTSKQLSITVYKALEKAAARIASLECQLEASTGERTLGALITPELIEVVRNEFILSLPYDFRPEGFKDAIVREIAV